MDIFHRSKWQGKWLKLLAATGVVAGAVGFGVVKAADTYGVSQQFSPNVVLSTAPLNKSTLQVTVYNLTNGDMPNLNLTDVLGAGISVAATPNAINSANCPGVSIAGSGQNVTISGASGIASGKSCVFSIDVEASTPGTFNADIAAGSPFTSSNTVPVAANAQLVVSNQTFVSPTLTHGRWEPTIYPGGVDHLVVDISNPNAAALPGGTFSFTIPAGTALVGTPAYNHPTYNGSNPNTGCNGTVTVSGSTVTVTNLTMPPMVAGVAGYCRLDYQLTSTVVGTYAVSSTAGTFSAAGGTISNTNASSTNFQVIPKPTLSLVKTFSRPVAPAVNWSVGQHPKVTLTVYNQTDDPWTNVTVADTMPAGLQVNTAVPATGTCNAAGTLTAPTASFVIPAVAANSSCTIVFETTVTSVPAGGAAENIIPANTMTRDPIRGDAGQVNNNSGSDKLAIAPVAPGGANLDTISKQFQSVIGAGLGNTGVIDGIAGGRVRLLFTVTKTLPDGLDYPLSNIKIEDDWSVSAPHILTHVAPGSILPSSEIYANNCGVDAAVNVINPKKLVLSGLAIPLGRTSCQVGVFLNVDPALVAPDPLNGVLETNTATACLDVGNSAANCSAAAKTSNQPTIELFSAQPLQVEKTANGAKTLTLALTQQFNYNFTIKNPSSVAATNVTMVDTLPAGVRFVSPLTVTGLSCVNATVGTAPTASGSTLTWVIPSMNGFDAAGTAASCSVSVLAEADPAVAVPGTPYTNTVEIGKVTANEGATRSNTLSSQALVTFRTAPEGLVLTKAFANPVVFKDNGDATLDTNLFGSGFDEATMLQFTLFNSSTTAGFTNVAFTDSLPAGVRVRNPATPVTTGTTCAGAVVDASVAGKVTVTVPSLAATVNCKVMVQVIGTVVGSYTNTIPAKSVTTNEGATNTVPTSADLTVVATAPGISVYKDVTALNGATSLHGTQVSPGDQLTYRLVLKNNNYPAAALKDYAPLVTDVLPVGMEFVSADNGGTASGQTVTWNFSGSSVVLDRNGTFPLNVTVRVKLDATGTLANVAKLGTSSSDCATPYAGGSCLATPPVAACVMPANPLAPSAAEIANPAICQPVAVKVAAVKHTLTKDVFAAGTTTPSLNTKLVAAGDKLTYVLTLKNTGEGALSVKDFVKTVTDKVPTGTTYVAGSASAGGTFAAGVVTWDLTADTSMLAKDASRTFSFDVTVDGTAVGPLTNVGKTSTETSNTVTNPVAAPSASLVKDVFKSSDLATSIDTRTVTAGDALTYKITLKNTGAGVLSLKDFVKTVTDTLPKGVTYVAGSADSGGVFTAAPAPGVLVWDFSTSSEVLAAGASKVLSFQVTVDASASGVIRNVAVTPGSSSNTVTNPVTASRHTLVKDVFKSSDLTSSINGKNVSAGDELTYTLTLRNAGPGPLSVKDFVRTITDALPKGVTYVAGSADNGGTFNPSPAPGVVVWDLSNSTEVMAVGATKVFSFKVKVDLTASGVISNVAKAGSDDSNTVTNPVTPPKHSIVKDVFKTGSTSSIKGTTVAAGDLLTYQITVTNTGAGDLSVKDFVKSVTDTLPAGVTVIRISEGGVGDRTIVWDLSSSTRVLKPGESMVFTVDVKVNDDASGSLKNVAKSPTEGSNEVENPVAAPKYALIKDVRKTGSVASIIGQDVLNRDTLTYVLTIRNTGAGNLVLKTAVKELRDALPAGTVFVSAGNGGVYSGGFVIWNLENDNTVLAPGASKEFSFNVAVAEDASMPLVNVAQTPVVSSCPLNDASCIANPPQPVCSMPANAEKLTAAESADPKVCKPVVNNVQLNTTLVVEKVADRQQAELGDSLKYTIRVRNAGQARATAVVLRDTLPAGFRYIAGTARLSNNAALAEPEGAPGPALAFHLGNLAPGAEITLTYRVRVGAGAVQGDGINRATACTTQNKILCSNEGRARVKVTGGVFTDEACIAGKVFVDVDGNRLQDAEEVGVPGVRLYMETGTFFITDVEGKYSYCGLSPKSHTIKVDPSTLPRSAELVPSSNRNLGDGNSLYLDVKRGELIRGDFIIGNPTDAVLNQVKARRAQGEVSGPQNERSGAPALVFESRKLTPLTSASPKEGINNTAEQAVPRVRDPQAGVESCAPGACDQAPLRVDPQRVLPALEGSASSGKP